jgi:hypothetical protein
VAGFEPAASCSQSRRDNRATLHPEGYPIKKNYIINSNLPYFEVAKIILIMSFTNQIEKKITNYF